MSEPSHFKLDGEDIPCRPGQTVMQAAQAAGRYIPHLCWHPDFAPHGSCKICVVKADGRTVAACTFEARPGMQVENRTPEMDDHRRRLLNMLFVEGNHFCPSCEKSGNCTLQATAYELGMANFHFDHFFPDRPVDASHPDVMLDFNRCIQCELCVRASRDVDGKQIFALAGRGIRSHLIVNSASGRLADSNFAVSDRAASVCPVGVILKKRVGFAIPIGSRRYDAAPISAEAQPSPPPAQGERP
ncbi:MAG: (2Fe-2S)-binding protein [Rhodocyclaceae bacterium]|nr:(2Fe-2S)-binding protein [Rhodocyclaceae bacterium]